MDKPLTDDIKVRLLERARRVVRGEAVEMVGGTPPPGWYSLAQEFATALVSLLDAPAVPPPVPPVDAKENPDV